MSEHANTQESYASGRSDDREWDDIVIGSGMGGMTAAAMLSLFGHRVLVVEQQPVAGGFTHTFERPPWRWDIGVHAVGDVHPEGLGGQVTHALSRGRLEWARTANVYDHIFFPGLDVGYCDNEGDFERTIASAFPRERVSDYLRITRETTDALPPHQLSLLVPSAIASVANLSLARRAHAYALQTTRSVLDKLSNDDRYKSVLAAQWGYYGAPPSRSSWMIHASIARHFFSGCYYPVGGAGSIADGFLRTVAECGGWTRVSAPVAEIVVRDGRARGVRLESGEILRARRVVSDAGAKNTVERLLPAELRSAAWAQSIGALPMSPGHVGLTLGFKGDIRAAGASSCNQYVYNTWNHEKVVWDVENRDAPAPAFFLSFASLKDPRHDPGPEQIHTGEAIAFVPWEPFARLDGQRTAYTDLKESVERRFLEQVLRHFPGLRPMVACHDLSTPLTTARFSRSPFGGMYGLAPTPERFTNRYLRPRTPVRGLFLAGCDVGAMGVAGAMTGGAIAAAAIEPVKALRWLRSKGFRL